MKFEEEIKKNQREQRDHIEKSIDFSLDNAFQDEIEKAVNHKYFKREGNPGNYKYYYTEAEYKQTKGLSPKKEENKKPIIENLIEKLQPTIDKMVDNIERKFNEDEKNIRPFNSYDRVMVDLTLKADIVNSFAKYTEKTDNLVGFSVDGSVSGQLTINSKIEREGRQHNLATQVIYAGGHNIQKLHYRYLTSTSLPKKVGEVESNVYTEKIKKLSKAEKSQAFIDSLHSKIIDAKNKLEAAKLVTDEGIIDKEDNYKMTKTTWSEIVKRGADKNYDYSEEKFNNSVKEFRESLIDSFKRIHIKYKEQYIKDTEALINKENAKLEKLLNEQ